MPESNLQYIWNQIVSVVYSFGGPILIIGGISKYIGDSIANQQIIKIEAKYQKEIEERKTELEKSKSQFFRYSEEQFKLYNNLWKILMRTTSVADDLWKKADPQKLPSFAEQISLTRTAVMDSMLLIEEEHFEDLDDLLKSFEKFKFGKLYLIDIRSQEDGSTNSTISKKKVSDILKKNKKIKKEYSGLVMKIGKSLRNQIKG